jgi:ABC-2 type transport system ATP-binding protein
MLEAQNLTKDFSSLRAVDDLSFEVEPGRVCGFVGPNGAGKTTTMRVIATLETPTGGNVMVNGVSILEDPYAVRRMFGFMPDYYGVYTGLTCRDCLEFFARAYELDSQTRHKRIEQILAFTGLDQLADKKVETLSKGMNQRLNLSRALINDPPVMVMDEPAAGLDPRARVELRYLIRALADQGKAVLVSSHILSELGEMCDKALFIDKGRRVAYGGLDDLQTERDERIEIRVRVLSSDEAPAVERFLAARPAIEDVRRGENGLILFVFTDPPDRVPNLLREMMNEKFSIFEFRPKDQTMEDIFMRVTEASATGGGIA